MTALQSTWNVHFPFIRNAFLAMLAYRLRYYTGIITYLVFVSVHYFIWRAVFANSDRVIHGFTFQEMVTYVVVGWISRSLYFSDIDEEMDDLVRTGQMSVVLTRPINFQLAMLFQALGGAIFRAVCFSVPLAIFILLFFPIIPPKSASSFLLFLFSTGIAFVIFAEVNFLVGLLAFSLKSIQGITRAKYFLMQLLSGLLLPLNFFPLWAQHVLDFLPFKTISYVPLQFYLGKVTSLPLVMINQLFWVIALYLLGHFLWHRALSKLTLQGG